MLDELSVGEPEASGFIPRHLRSWLHPSERQLGAEEAPEATSPLGLVERHGA